MNIAEALLPEFDHEMTNTRKMLERVPNDKLEWGPHAKSMTLGGLTTHIANLPTWRGTPRAWGTQCRSSQTGRRGGSPRS